MFSFQHDMELAPAWVSTAPEEQRVSSRNKRVKMRQSDQVSEVNNIEDTINNNVNNNVSTASTGA